MGSRKRTAHATSIENEFDRALRVSFQVRRAHGGNISRAFREFVGDPGIVARWSSLSGSQLTYMMDAATALVVDAQEMGRGGIFDNLPKDILGHGKYVPFVNAASSLVDAGIDELDNRWEECSQMVMEMDAADLVAVFAALVMALRPPRP